MGLITNLRNIALQSLFVLSASASLSNSTTTYDVCIIGGGSSGTYAAIRLQQLGHSVAVIEKESRLGGHVNTYHDPVSGVVFDFGVSIFENSSVVAEYFASLNVPLVAESLDPSSTIYANFKTDGKATDIPDSIPWSNQTALGEALYEYASILEQYPYLSNGYDLPTPVPEDLLLPWGDFIEKYDLSALAYVVFLYGQGSGDILAQPTLYATKAFSLELASILLGEGGSFVTSGSNGNQELYDQALSQLGDNAFLNTTSTAITRDDDGVTIVAYSSTSGTSTTIRAKKLLIAIEPTLANIQGLGLDVTSDEQNLLQQFSYSYYWDAVVKAPGTPANTGFDNVDLSEPYGIPVLPALYTFSAVPGTVDLMTAYFGSSYYLSDDEAQLSILDEVSNVLSANGYNTTESPEIVAFHNHSPFQLTVSANSIQNGFYDQMNALQGELNTWWTGAAWQAQDSSEIWSWTEAVLLPKILDSL